MCIGSITLISRPVDPPSAAALAQSCRWAFASRSSEATCEASNIRRSLQTSIMSATTDSLLESSRYFSSRRSMCLAASSKAHTIIS
jgi:hypothetical protein